MIWLSPNILLATDCLCSVCAVSVLYLLYYDLGVSYECSTSKFLSLKFSNKWLVLELRKTTKVSLDSWSPEWNSNNWMRWNLICRSQTVWDWIKSMSVRDHKLQRYENIRTVYIRGSSVSFDVFVQRFPWKKNLIILLKKTSKIKK